MKKFLTITFAAVFTLALFGDNCQKLSFDEVYLEYGSYLAYETNNAAGDTTKPDLLWIDFWDGSGNALDKLEVGSYPLTDYESCDTCITLYEDMDINTFAAEKLYSQTNGTFNITKVKEGTKESQGNASFRLVEVDDYYQPVDGGKCYDVDDLTWDTICIPDCTGKVCGSDGCSSVCGQCGKNQGCSHDQSKCEDLDLSDCTGISIDFGTLKKHFSNSFETSSKDGRPYVYMVFFLGENESKIKAGTYDLGSDKNLNYDTCSEAVKLYAAYDPEFGDYTKMYFQHGGTLIVDSVADKNMIKGTISVKLVEADIAEDNSTTFFTGSKCLEIETSAFDVANSHDPTDPADECMGQKECDTNADCDPGYACDGCWCYIEDPDDTDTDSGSESQKECKKHTDCDPGYYCERDGKCSECYEGLWECHSDSDCEFGTRCTDGCWCYFDNLDDTDTDNSGSNDSSDSGSNNSGSSDNTDSDNSSEPASGDTADDSSTDSKGSDGCSVLMI
ncbi:hypothetical protein IKS86_09960 [bacterium]|nr:hypothetical protein [bacterium]